MRYFSLAAMPHVSQIINLAIPFVFENRSLHIHHFLITEQEGKASGSFQFFF